MSFDVRPATSSDIGAIRALIGASVRGLQMEYTAAEREAALSTVFTVDSRLIADGTYFVAYAGAILAGCGGWSFRKTLYGGDQQVEAVDPGVLDPAVDAAKIRAIFVHPDFARQGLGGLILRRAEEAAFAAGFQEVEMGSTLSGLPLYLLNGYGEGEATRVPIGDGLTIQIVRMQKKLVRPERVAEADVR